ncbi:hypothetical protein EVAR_56485_1 [Eumeta japonica]|uniref:Uncharacterized protein n=1 Tax=Eumeta variegata TaxID=151549 RepID=A0A4C1XLI4_EUMVA|nr:hypothetical protein EVAR_56485_1 [Eumeta japonica]
MQYNARIFAALNCLRMMRCAGYYPKRWKLGEWIFLHKHGKDNRLASPHRPITQLSTMVKHLITKAKKVKGTLNGIIIWRFKVDVKVKEFIMNMFDAHSGLRHHTAAAKSIQNFLNCRVPREPSTQERGARSLFRSIGRCPIVRDSDRTQPTRELFCPLFIK